MGASENYLFRSFGEQREVGWSRGVECSGADSKVVARTLVVGDILAEEDSFEEECCWDMGHRLVELRIARVDSEEVR